MRFLRNLKKNNDRDWFRERKDLYEQSVRHPMELLVSEAAVRCRQNGLPLHTKDRSPVMRVYRDIRFSDDKRPFKSHVGASLRNTKTQFGELYIHISPEEAFLAAGFWMPERPFLQLWRQSMTENPQRFLKVEKSLQKAGLTLSHENRLTRLPRGFDAYAESGVAEHLRLTSYVTTQALRPQDCTSPKLLETVCAFALGAKPLLEYGWSLNYTPRRDILEER